MSTKIQIKTTCFHKIVSYLCQVLLIGSFVYLFMTWNQIPDQVPGHYNGAGEITRWGSKYELFIVPIISLIIYLGISLIEKFPEVWNTGVKVTEKNREQVYKELKNMIVSLNFFMVLTFTSLTVMTSLGKPLPSWFLPVDMLLIFGSMGIFIIRVIRASKK